MMFEMNMLISSDYPGRNLGVVYAFRLMIIAVVDLSNMNVHN
uniref:Uncharacterized protein n=1 Tax=Arundo donax TaxID=35708 RepID=A0A0A9HBM2_ARUDO